MRLQQKLNADVNKTNHPLNSSLLLNVHLNVRLRRVNLSIADFKMIMYAVVNDIKR